MKDHIAGRKPKNSGFDLAQGMVSGADTVVTGRKHGAPLCPQPQTLVASETYGEPLAGDTAVGSSRSSDGSRS